mmetsp:Transcript_72453/g.195919  ORF Transcript_72453/g.195919 Transcript_72453/m.195919 type:complete len:379 (+) Transcript_72453:496-1632(+)
MPACNHAAELRVRFAAVVRELPSVVHGSVAVPLLAVLGAHIAPAGVAAPAGPMIFERADPGGVCQWPIDEVHNAFGQHKEDQRRSADAEKSGARLEDPRGQPRQLRPARNTGRSLVNGLAEHARHELLQLRLFVKFPRCLIRSFPAFHVQLISDDQHHSQLVVDHVVNPRLHAVHVLGYQGQQVVVVNQGSDLLVEADDILEDEHRAEHHPDQQRPPLPHAPLLSYHPEAKGDADVCRVGGYVGPESGDPDAYLAVPQRLSPAAVLQPDALHLPPGRAFAPLRGHAGVLHGAVRLDPGESDVAQGAEHLRPDVQRVLPDLGLGVGAGGQEGHLVRLQAGLWVAGLGRTGDPGEHVRGDGAFVGEDLHQEPAVNNAPPP